ncbi:helix-turn-helix domain-containing protein [Methylobacterium sp. E-046]|uniref:helix-turn-helix domain-containing protein n=1 Tax=Methylobacterium sp. E-046 TaxID=2836576 RepID=UPI001FBB67E2|nr:helix-turn-helix domain-containing protein [Methylobacterium sp. E-046]MCJ2100700.1 helix-turn-helix domain-containing protein [Methylobacterium sp. E-046]
MAVRSEPEAEPTRAARPDTQAPRPLAYRPKDAATVLGVSKSTIYQMIADGALPARKLGASTVILRSDLVALLEALPLTASAAKAHTSPD